MPYSASSHRASICGPPEHMGFPLDDRDFRSSHPTLKSYQFNNLPLGVLIGIDVPLGYAQARMASQHLHVSE